MGCDLDASTSGQCLSCQTRDSPWVSGWGMPLMRLKQPASLICLGCWFSVEEGDFIPHVDEY